MNEISDFLEGSESWLRRMESLKDSMGDVLLESWSDPDVLEVNLNDDGKLWIKQRRNDYTHLLDMTANNALNIISAVAMEVREIVSFENYKLECEFPLDGSRFSALVPPVVRAPSFSLRKHNPVVLPLTDYVENGVFPHAVFDMICAAIEQRLNILVVGATASGKTTLTNSIIHQMALHNPCDRVVMVEDTRELKSNFPNTLSLRTTKAAPLADAISVVLRHSPDRIIVGEVRDGAALSVLSLWNTGHPGGICTIHANSAVEALPRMEDMVRQACGDPLRVTVGQAVDRIVFLEKVRAGVGRKVTEMQACYGYDEKKMHYKMEVLYHDAV